jgi:hypothetical protein
MICSPFPQPIIKYAPDRDLNVYIYFNHPPTPSRTQNKKHLKQKENSKKIRITHAMPKATQMNE